ncbi:MAG: hypothetical protein LUH22_06735 [Bacteroides sp.]|nr:hypothetical protein [Bacteroides sp.]
MKERHFLFESIIWESVSEFVTPNGDVSKGIGESVIQLNGDLITNESWAIIKGKRVDNNYKIRRLSENRYQYTSQNPKLGTQKGYFDISGSIIYSKFMIENTQLNGYEIIRRIDDICYSIGALYNGDELVNTWNATLRKRL